MSSLSGGGGGGCPVKDSSDSNSSSCPVKSIEHTQTNTYLTYLQGFFTSSNSKNSTKATESDRESLGYNAAANDAHFDQKPGIGQQIPLSTKRAVSSIPKGDYSPEHQPENSEKWVYPSEQQYYNAMKVLNLNFSHISS
jgi:hypothetical protein